MTRPDRTTTRHRKWGTRRAAVCSGKLAAALVAITLLPTAGCSATAPADADEEPRGFAQNIEQKMNEASDQIPGLSGQTSEGETVTVTRVIDGDTIRVSEPAAGVSREVRLLYVDAPESYIPNEEPQPYGKQASDYTTAMLEGEKVRLGYDVENADPYERALATVTIAGAGRTFNETMVQQGYAQAYIVEPNDAMASEVYQAQDEAQDASAGIWGLSFEQQCRLTDRGNPIGENGPGC